MFRLTEHDLPHPSTSRRAIAALAWQVGLIWLLLGISHPGRANDSCWARQESSAVPREPVPLRPPSLSTHNPRPPAEGLRDDHPTQVRVDLSRWRTTVGADRGKVTLAGRLPDGRSREGASCHPIFSASLQALFCTWVI